MSDWGDLSLLLQAIRNDDYSAVRRIRMLEEQLDVAGGAPKAIVIATVNMNRLVSFCCSLWLAAFSLRCLNAFIAPADGTLQD